MVADALPEPGADQQARSGALEERIREAAEAAGGTLDFARFMELALYSPGLGYYSAATEVFGADGDFVTAPELSPLFGQCVAAYAAPVLEHLGGGDILELGGGSGALAGTVLSTLAAMDRLPARYLMLDVSGTRQGAQRLTLAGLEPALRERVTWLDRLPREPLRGVVLANEVADAIPCHCVRLAADAVAEWRVGWDGDRFAWVLGPLRDEAVAAACGRAAEAMGGYPATPYDTEVAPARRGWLASTAAVLEAGAVLALDYGHERRELYHPRRRGGTLACHYRHRVHHDPLRLVGLQDITSHVDFTDLAEAAVEAGLAVAGFTTQAQFLLGLGLTERAGLAGGVTDGAGLARSAQVKRLTLPGEMGEVFKALALGRGLPPGLLAFPGRDMRARL